MCSNNAQRMPQKAAQNPAKNPEKTATACGKARKTRVLALRAVQLLMMYTHYHTCTELTQKLQAEGHAVKPRWVRDTLIKELAETTPHGYAMTTKTLTRGRNKGVTGYRITKISASHGRQE